MTKQKLREKVKKAFEEAFDTESMSLKEVGVYMINDRPYGEFIITSNTNKGILVDFNVSDTSLFRVSVINDSMFTIRGYCRRWLEFLELFSKYE